MLYSMYFKYCLYLCSIIKRKYKPTIQTGESQKMKIMNTVKESNVRTLAMLKYQADRDQSLGNGVMSQRINAQIRSILVEMNNSSAKN